MALLLGFFSGAVAGLCAAPLWMMLGLPMRIADLSSVRSMRLCGWALALGAALGSLPFSGFLPDFFGMGALLLGGIFVGMLSSALVEAVEVIPRIFDWLQITMYLRLAALALAIGKTAGALLSGWIGGM